MNPPQAILPKILLEKVMALPRFATADDNASLVAYLVGPEAAYVTRASLSINGGFTPVIQPEVKSGP
jgi:3-oxoacyl-[acyl-carrier protein] reductase